jgi:hypothetical protein
MWQTDRAEDKKDDPGEFAGGILSCGRPADQTTSARLPAASPPVDLSRAFEEANISIRTPLRTSEAAQPARQAEDGTLAARHHADRD